MKSLSKLSVFLLTALSMASASVLYSTKPSFAGKSDNINVYRYCHTNQKALTGSIGWSVEASPIDPENAFSWRCNFIKAGRVPVTVEPNLDIACLQQYPEKNWIAQYKKQDSAYSWYCDYKK